MPCPSVQASRPRSASLAAFWRSCCGVRSVGRGAGPRAGLVRLALAGEVQGGRLHVLPCADEIDLAWTQGSREWLALETFIDT